MSIKMWENGMAKTITFVVTKDCQLACKYCYLPGKTAGKRMSWETAKAAVDFLLAQTSEEFNTESVVFDFIGGEPFLEIDLIDRMCDYIKRRLFELDHPWFNLYRFAFSTNGINYHTPRIREFIRKNHAHLSIGITIDGTRAKHDLNRVWRDDPTRGSYDDVVANIPLWLSEFPDSATKVTVSSPDLPYIAESVIHLFGLGIRTVNINCVFEDVWADGDDAIFEEQLRILAKRLVDEKWTERGYMCSFFNRTIGFPLDPEKETANWCGSGKMLAIDPDGNFYPCNRFLDFSLRSKKPRRIGSIATGIDRNRLRPFIYLDRQTQSPQRCLECDIASGCAWCQGENYDAAQTPTIYRRATAICLMHAARVRANRYYWELLGDPLPAPRKSLPATALDKSPAKIRTVDILLDSALAPVCGYNPFSDPHEQITADILRRFASALENNPVDVNVIHGTNVPQDVAEILDGIPHRKIAADAHGGYKAAEDFHTIAMTFEEFYARAEHLPLEDSSPAARLNVMLHDYRGFDAEAYRAALSRLKDRVLDQWRNERKIRLNILTDPASLRNVKECGAGTQSVTLAPNGRYYICPAFYYADPQDSIGSVETGWDIPDHKLLRRDHAPLCRACRLNACTRCIFENRASTGEHNTPSYEQCQKAHVELEASRQFYKELKQCENPSDK